MKEAQQLSAEQQRVVHVIEREDGKYEVKLTDEPLTKT